MIDGVYTVQLSWKMMKDIMDLPTEFEQAREMAKRAWWHIVQANFQVVRDA